MSLIHKWFTAFRFPLVELELHITYFKKVLGQNVHSFFAPLKKECHKPKRASWNQHSMLFLTIRSMPLLDGIPMNRVGFLRRTQNDLCTEL